MKTKPLSIAEPMLEALQTYGFDIALLTTSHVAKIPLLERRE